MRSAFTQVKSPQPHGQKGVRQTKQRTKHAQLQYTTLFADRLYTGPSRQKQRHCPNLYQLNEGWRTPKHSARLVGRLEGVSGG